MNDNINLKESTSLKSNTENIIEDIENKKKNKETKKESIRDLILTIIFIFITICIFLIIIKINKINSSQKIIHKDNRNIENISNEKQNEKIEKKISENNEE